LPGRGGQTPGGAEISSEIFLGPLRSILRRTGDGRRFAAGQIKVHGRRHSRRARPSERENHPWRGRKLKGGSSHTRCLQRRRPRTFAECIAREASEAASAMSRRGRSSQRHAGRVGRETEPRTRKGKPSEGEIPGALPSEIGRKGFGGNNASGGCETLKAQRNRVRQARGMSLPDSASAGGTRTLERCVSPRGFTPADFGHTPEGNESSRGVRGIN
jgi:hypothetical protein